MFFNQALAEVIVCLAQIEDLAPELRLGQVIENVHQSAKNKGKDPFFVSNSEFPKIYREYIEELKTSRCTGSK